MRRSPIHSRGPISCIYGVQAGDGEDGGIQFVAERAELLLRQAARHGLATRTQALQWLGSHFRVALDLPHHRSDYQVGLLLTISN